MVPASAAHAAHVACNLREADRLELSYSDPESPPETAAMDSFLESGLLCFAIVVRGEAVAMFGCGATEAEGVGSAWMLGTDDIKFAFPILSRQLVPWLDWMNEFYPILVNYVHADNRVALRWVSWGGFTFNEPVTINGADFIPITRRAACAQAP